VPNVPETYVHRIGRTARAGAAGTAISLCDGEEAAFLRDIEKLIRMTIPASDRRADQRRPEPRHAAGSAIKPAVNAKGRRGDRNGPARKQSRHNQPNHGQRNHGQTNEAPRGIDAVGFMRRKGTPQRDRAALAPRLAGGPSQGA
jgi:ATP-dependent RNA helicase RhlE